MSEGKKVIVPIVCVAKSSKDLKEFWKAQGLDLAVCEAKLTYKFLSGLEGTPTGLKIKAAIQNMATEISGILDAALPAGKLKDNELEAVSQLEQRTTALAFGKTIRADAIRVIADLPKLPASVDAGSDEEEASSEGIEL